MLKSRPSDRFEYIVSVLSREENWVKFVLDLLIPLILLILEYESDF